MTNRLATPPDIASRVWIVLHEFIAGRNAGGLDSSHSIFAADSAARQTHPPNIERRSKTMPANPLGLALRNRHAGHHTLVWLVRLSSA